ncbi:MAG: efflux RND transporter periplasmic adaptor subunit [Bryobacteraceae bacterium]|nr:efflux RND transporter periplasmic adaptor subunit [Bryobacteraceae bacterium]
MRKWIQRLVWAAVAMAAVAGVAYLMQSEPAIVDTAQVVSGPLRVTIDQEGKTRAHDRFVIAAPVAGRLERLELHEGDSVQAGQVVASIHPVPLDPREREQLAARLESARNLQREANAAIGRVQADFEQKRRDRERNEILARNGDIPQQTLEQSRSAEKAAAAELAAMRFRAEAAESDVRAAQAALMATENRSDGSQVVKLRSPVRGRVLQVMERSERVVASGAAVVVLGDATHLEIVIDVLSTDAVKVRAGMPVLLEGWGGGRTLRARVRTVEPYAFTKVSALGIEEQRVNVIADFVDPPGPLGDGYRVEARIIIWEAPNVTKLPASSLFRRGEKWAVFVIQNGVATVREVEIGRRGEFEVEVRGGVKPSEIVVVHPPNSLAEGAKVRARTAG